MLTSGMERVNKAPAKRAKLTPAQIEQVKLKRAQAPKKTPVDTGYVDLANATYACDTTGTITLLATIAQGTTVNQRVGKRAQYRSVQIRGNVQTNTATIESDVAILLVYDRCPTTTLPAITDILVTANSHAFNNDNNSGRFRIVRRWDVTLVGNTTAPATGKESLGFDEFVNLKGLNVVFKALGTGAIADIEEGAMYLVTVGDQAAGTTAAALVAGFRVRFVDV